MVVGVVVRLIMSVPIDSIRAIRETDRGVFRVRFINSFFAPGQQVMSVAWISKGIPDVVFASPFILSTVHGCLGKCGAARNLCFVHEGATSRESETGRSPSSSQKDNVQEGRG